MTDPDDRVALVAELQGFAEELHNKNEVALVRKAAAAIAALSLDDAVTAADLYAALWADAGDGYVGDAAHLDDVTLDGAFDLEAVAKRLAMRSAALPRKETS